MLPIQKVILYKHGVGYFERQGKVREDASIDLRFRAKEMNDVLKSLTVLDLDGGIVSSISYESTKPVERQLDDIAIRIPDQNALTGLLAQVKGARLAVELGPKRRVEGVVTGTETVTRKSGDTTTWTTYLTLLVDGGSLQTFDVLEVRSLSFLDEGVKKDLQHLLDVLIAAKKKDLKRRPSTIRKGADTNSRGRRPVPLRDQESRNGPSKRVGPRTDPPRAVRRKTRRGFQP